MIEPLKLKPRDVDALREFTQKIRALLGSQLVEVRIFGSKVRGEDTPDSDIDLAIIVRETGTEIEDQILDVAFDVNLAWGVYISPRVIPQAVLDDPVWRLTAFLQAVQKEGTLL